MRASRGLRADLATPSAAKKPAHFWRSACTASSSGTAVSSPWEPGSRAVAVTRTVL